MIQHIEEHVLVRLAGAEALGIKGKRSSSGQRGAVPRNFSLGTHQMDLDQRATRNSRLALSLLSTHLHYSRAELKKSRNTQVQLSGHLIQAQEKERSRLASELHDDFSQRLALLALRLQITAKTLPDSSDTLKQTLDDFSRSVTELGDDLHSLSHQLHSSTLDTLGLVIEVSVSRVWRQARYRSRFHIQRYSAQR
jgi:signal transduction histidine kinase